MVPGLDEPPDRVTSTLKNSGTPPRPQFPGKVFWGIITLGFVWPWVMVIAVDRYLGSGRLRGFFAVYTETPVIYLLLFVSQAFWCALPFVVYAWASRRLFNASAAASSAVLLPCRTGVIVMGVGAFCVLSWTQAVAWKEYFASPSGSFGISVALSLPSMLALVAMPALYGLGWAAGKAVGGARR